MNDMIIEVMNSQVNADERANYYQQLGYNVASNQCNATWINNGQSDTANFMWVVIATKAKLTFQPE